ncbi:MAG: HD-GYP domain-containing protein [bacterium]|nr:HD-GYP domain-containing protein [bacterium]
MAIKKLSIAEVKIGMYVHSLDISWFKHPFLRNSFIISSEEDLAKLQKCGATYVYVDTERGLYNFETRNQDYGRDLVSKWRLKGIDEGECAKLQDIVPRQEELKTSRKIYYQTRKILEDAYHRAAKGKPINWNEIFKVADAAVESVFRNKDAFLSLGMIKNYDAYTFYHSLNVSCLCITVGRYLFFDKEDLIALGVGALLHDIGKVRIPEKIINKLGRLTEEEFSIIKKHPEYSQEILSRCPHIRWDSVHLAYQHHERFDGSGYPLGLKGFRINQFALIAAVADVFDALTSDRPYRSAMSPAVAIAKMLEQGERDFCFSYLLKFIQCLGIYPIGTVVELDSRQIGIVTEINHLNLERPTILALYDSQYRRLKEPQVIDLASEQYQKIGISRCLDPAKIEVDIRQFLESGKV